MKQIARLDTNHDDLVHGLAYDYYGKRLVSCSSDQKLKVWDYRDSKGAWELNESWKAHEASILKTCWTHPEFGQVIASCSFDRTVRIWEESSSFADHHGSGSGISSRRWVERARLVEARGAVLDIAFAPHHLGLKLATISSDGCLRIYEAMDVVNMSQWTLMDEVIVGAVGICESGGVRDPIQEGYCLAWCQSRFGPPQLAIGCGPDNTVKILRSDPNSPSHWSFKEALPGHEGVIHAVSWAPNPGRTHELIATACKDRRIRIFKLSDHPPHADPVVGSVAGGSIYFGSPFGENPPVIDSQLSTNDTSPQIASSSISEQPFLYHVSLVATLPDHRAEVWQVDFNILGTILASSGDDGKVRLFKAISKDNWKCMSVISSETSRTSNISNNLFMPSSHLGVHGQNVANEFTD
ncbi:epoxide hydrolase, soluble (sEH) [Entomophthora muscae]|uniref:Epoxide hydrolase, soluble (SEH) n=1 Tax=Entomophthora muscae TaxID=34485 RepID=A0ACC2TMB1_9FUNG|nr:epoxide hydrolase, soluble (sEH) [Entomophthora muscae]